jgi:hypothetical protein
MGCFKSKEETIFDKLDYKLEPMGVEEFDKAHFSFILVLRKWSQSLKQN